MELTTTDDLSVGELKDIDSVDKQVVRDYPGTMRSVESQEPIGANKRTLAGSELETDEDEDDDEEELEEDEEDVDLEEDDEDDDDELDDEEELDDEDDDEEDADDDKEIPSPKTHSKNKEGNK